MLYILTHWLSNDKKYRTNECKKKSKFVEQKKPSDKCLDCRSGKKKNDRIKHSTICLRLVIWLLLIFLLNVYIYTNINNKKREKKKRHLSWRVYVKPSSIGDVWSWWWEMCMRWICHSHSFLFFCSIEWPCLIDWSRKSTTDRHTQSSTQTDDGDGREIKHEGVYERKENGEISWGI
jgi:hypothetical protein